MLSLFFVLFGSLFLGALLIDWQNDVRSMSQEKKI